MVKIKGNHEQFHLMAGDSIQVDGGPIGTVIAVHPKFSTDGLYGQVATYRVATDDGTLVWMPDYRVTAVAYRTS